ncbi:MAG: hypothetical protein HUK15_06025, partial [Bacteroidales bacterium]|nr:hypothetical protein [Bacteroidales bacterium]
SCDETYKTYSNMFITKIVSTPSRNRQNPCPPIYRVQDKDFVFLCGFKKIGTTTLFTYTYNLMVLAGINLALAIMLLLCCKFSKSNI